MLNKIHHIAIICSDYKASKLFYTQVLGLDIINETYREERASCHSGRRPLQRGSCGLRWSRSGRGSVQHRHDRLPGDHHRSVLCRSDRCPDFPPCWQLRGNGGR